jgi:class 3 adenylate cyclase
MRCLNEDPNSTRFLIVNNLTAGVSILTAVYLLPLVPNLFSTIDDGLVQYSRSSSIVEDLYPDAFRERLYESLQVDEEEQEQQQQQCPTLLRRSSSDHRMRDFILNDTEARFQRLTNAKPIADLFLHTTIMFADMVGFTSWASRQDNPKNVFVLLETLFWAYDQIAETMDVFKLGTIGDCYIAITGLPTPRDDHAVVMARFAEACRRKTMEVFSRLDLELDLKTNNMSMRFGIHSGPVVGGVLRGHKSRL